MMGLAGNDLADAACKLVVIEHRAPRSVRAAMHSANLEVTCMAHWIARIGSAKQRRDIDLGVGERARHVCRQRLRAPLHTLSAPRAYAAQRNKSGLTGLRGTESLIFCREAQ